MTPSASLLILASCLYASASDGVLLSVTSGLAPHQVAQCDDNGQAELVFTGSTTGNVQGALEGRVVKADASKDIIVDWTPLGNITGDAWTARLPGVPVGGPYALESRIVGVEGAMAEVTPFFVGDLWLLAGQSNMQGAGNMRDVTPPNDQVMLFGANDVWSHAYEPLHRPWFSSYPVYNPTGRIADKDPAVQKGVGPGLPFAVEVVRATGHPIGLIPCAVGGTSMDQWSPDLKAQGGASLYGAMRARFAAAGGRIKGMLWYQGESDGSGPVTAAPFSDKFKRFVESVRQDFAAQELPFYYVQIGRFVVAEELEPSWNAVQRAQLALEREIPHCGMVPAVDAGLDDLVHLGTPGQKRVGQRLARLVLRDVYGKGQVLSGPRPESAVWVDTPFGPRVEVTFTGVNGRLVSNGDVSGFSICDAEGNPVPAIYKQEFDATRPNAVLLWFTNVAELRITVPETAVVWYGRGRNPHCTVSDEAGMGMPVFGQMPIQRPPAVPGS